MISRLFLLLALLLASCGGGGSAPAPLAPEVDLREAGAIVTFAHTGRAPGDVALQLTFSIEFDDYFRCVPAGHIGVMTRASLDRVTSAQYRGVGWIAGKFNSDSHGTRNLPNLQPVAVVETWSVGAVPDNFDFLLAPTISPPLRDGVAYELSFHSAPSSGANTVGYVLSDPAGVVIDTGQVVDVNSAIDPAEQAIGFFDASGPAICPYTVRIIQPTAKWSPDSGLPFLTPVPLADLH